MITPPLPPKAVSEIYDLIALILDPKACKERLTALVEAQDVAKDEAFAAAKLLAEASQAKAEAADMVKMEEIRSEANDRAYEQIQNDKASLAASQAEHVSLVAGRAQAFEEREASISAREGSVSSREEVVAKREKELADLLADTRKVKADYDAKMVRIRSLTE